LSELFLFLQEFKALPIIFFLPFAKGYLGGAAALA